MYVPSPYPTPGDFFVFGSDLSSSTSRIEGPDDVSRRRASVIVIIIMLSYRVSDIPWRWWSQYCVKNGLY